VSGPWLVPEAAMPAKMIFPSGLPRALDIRRVSIVPDAPTIVPPMIRM
jgi:hypothetical protein